MTRSNRASGQHGLFGVFKEVSCGFFGFRSFGVLCRKNVQKRKKKALDSGLGDRSHGVCAHPDPLREDEAACHCR